MKLQDLIKTAHRLAEPYRVSEGLTFRLKDVDPGDTGDLTSDHKPAAKEGLALWVTALSEMQEMLFAQDKWSVLLIFEAMDAAGKDGAIRHVMSGVNPQGCQVYSFKTPSAEESPAVIDRISALNLHFPEIGPEKRAELAKARRFLLSER